MRSTKNPFPGMNPFFERNWHPVHTRLIAYLSDEISVHLPDDLVANPEERLLLEETGEDETYRGDINIHEVWKQGERPAWTPEVVAGVPLAEPQIIRVCDEVERWVEIRTVDGRLVTVIELLSPANKGAHRERYKKKQNEYLCSTASLVEIDLLRGGHFTVAAPEELIRKPAGTCYYICLRRAWRVETSEVYCCPLRERLPVIRIPLRPTDRDLVLDLQPLLDRCYEVGRYHKSRFDEIPGPPLPSEEAAWVDEHVRAAGLRG